MTTLEKIRAEIEQIADEEQKHDEKWAIGLRYAVKIIDKYAEQEPCDDAISRQAVLDLCDSTDPEYKVIHFKEDVECLPSVRPQEQTGKWIYSDDDNILYDSYWCSECRTYITVDHEKTDDIGFVIEDMDYCPRCGAKMVKPQESEVNNG